jgi:Regulator of chromosome condensation (RCC1) repeat
MYGKLGHGNENGSAVPKKVESLSSSTTTAALMQHVACGSRHTVAVTTTGVLYSWGDREQGVSGHGDGGIVVAAPAGAPSVALLDLGHQLIPKLVERLATKRIVQVSACGFHTGCLTVRNQQRCGTCFLLFFVLFCMLTKRRGFFWTGQRRVLHLGRRQVWPIGPRDGTQRRRANIGASVSEWQSVTIVIIIIIAARPN